MCLLCREMYDARVSRLQRRLDARHDPNRNNPRRGRATTNVRLYLAERVCGVTRYRGLIV